MAITITNEQIKEIADDLRTEWDSDVSYSPEQFEVAVENWLLRTIHTIEENPTFYAPGLMNYYNSRVPEFLIECHCSYFGWTQCKNSPIPGSLFCQEHQPGETDR